MTTTKRRSLLCALTGWRRQVEELAELIGRDPPRFEALARQICDPRGVSELCRLERRIAGCSPRPPAEVLQLALTATLALAGERQPGVSR